jgi:Undecaprenyl-phosphate glucose phosphotransferase
VPLPPEVERPAKRISLQNWVILFVAADLTLLGALGLVPTWLGHALLPDLFPQFFEGQIPATGGALCIFIAAARSARLYRSSRVLEQRYALRRTFLVLLLTFAALMALAAAAKTTQSYSRLWFFTWMSACFVLIPAFRMLAVGRARAGMTRGAYVYKAISVGIGCSPLSAEAIAATSNGLVRAEKLATIEAAAALPELAEMVSREAIDKVYVTAPWGDCPPISGSLEALRSLSADVYLIAQAPQLADDVISVRRLGGDVTMQIGNRPIDGWNHWAKRVQDVAVALTAVVLLSSLLGLIAILIKLESPGPIFFRQRRMGFNGRTFELLKFRSMYAEHSDPDAEMQTSRNDPRVTRMGRMLRRTSLDELPQLFNVLRGEMSIVGPRPHALKTTAEGKMLADAMDGYASRHRVKPGITGWAQVNGLRGEIRSIAQLKRRVHLDREYIARWSMLLDLKIIALTLARIMTDPNAY